MGDRIYNTTRIDCDEHTTTSTQEYNLISTIYLVGGCEKWWSKLCTGAAVPTGPVTLVNCAWILPEVDVGLCTSPDLLPAKGNGRVPCKHSPLVTVPIASGREMPQRCTEENRLALQHQLDTLTLPSCPPDWPGVGATATDPLASWKQTASLVPFSPGHSGVSHSCGHGCPLF